MSSEELEKIKACVVYKISLANMPNPIFALNRFICYEFINH